jgi:ABC-type transporter Mla subunit MlaD
MDGRVSPLQVRIGLFVLVSLGVFLGIIYLLGAQARYFERKYMLIAEFTEVGGLIDGATVRLAGVQIGRVTDVALPREPGGKVRVTLSIARRSPSASARTPRRASSPRAARRQARRDHHGTRSSRRSSRATRW